MLLDLPPHILIEILWRLPSESVCCIRCVSKPLLKTAEDLYFVSLHTRRLLSATTNAVVGHQVPQLMSFAAPYRPERLVVAAVMQSVKYDGSALTTRGNSAIKVSASKSRLYGTPPYVIDFVFCNLFCFKNKYDSLQGVCFLIDPLRGKVLRLPKNDITSQRQHPEVILQLRDWYGMGFDNITNTLKILRVIQFPGWNRDSMVAQVLILGTSSWRQIPSSSPFPFFIFSHLFYQKNACAYGDMHWLDAAGQAFRIISFDFTKEEFCLTPHPNIQSSDDGYSLHLHLLTLRGSLALVHASLLEGMTTKIEVWVLKDYHKKEWTRDYSINIKMFDLYKEFGWSEDVTCGEWEHGIFFKNLNKINAFFLDLRYANSMNHVTYGTGNNNKIWSYTGSLISLKDYYSSLIEAERFLSGYYHEYM
ncbi:hypothetical protein M0R45_006798 [Rubus argutus]|uniref:F-box domain-containing protein n=1 Tax=Rubus argutus TaxID=59490 RepID=A0AAW1YRH6_RUBAR